MAIQTVRPCSITSTFGVTCMAVRIFTSLSLALDGLFFFSACQFGLSNFIIVFRSDWRFWYTLQVCILVTHVFFALLGHILWVYIRIRLFTQPP